MNGSDISNLKKRSNDLCAHHDDLVKSKTALVEDEALQQEIGCTWMGIGACVATSGFLKRLYDLRTKYRELIAQRDRAAHQYDADIEKVERYIRNTDQPFIECAKAWLKEIMRPMPAPDFGEYAMDCIYQLDSMTLKPLATILQSIDKFQKEISNWKFGKKEFFLPALSFQDLAA